jgi:hypothetical protein
MFKVFCKLGKGKISWFVVSINFKPYFKCTCLSKNYFMSQPQ